MKKVIAIFLLVLYAGVAFSLQAKCNACNGNSGFVSSSHHPQKSGECYCTQPDKNCCNNNAVICKKSNDDSQALIPFQPKASEAQMAILLTEFQINLYNFIRQQNTPRFTSFIPAKSSSERLALIHILRI